MSELHARLRANAGTKNAGRWVRLTQEQDAKVMDAAERAGVGISQVIRELIALGLEKLEEAK